MMCWKLCQVTPVTHEICSYFEDMKLWKEIWSLKTALEVQFAKAKKVPQKQKREGLGPDIFWILLV